MRIFQHIDELKDSDGVGNDAIGLHTQFRKLNIESNFITRLPRTGTSLYETQFYKIDHLPKFSNSDIHILHFGGHGYPLSAFLGAPGKKILRFHNITPAQYYKNTTTPEIYSAMEKFESVSYLELASMAISVDSVWCDSPFNGHVLQSYDFHSLFHVPICKQYRVETDLVWKSNQNDICFVGRFAPQKKWEDLIVFFSSWKQKYKDARLKCIGSVIGAFDGYFDFLQQITNNLGIKDSVDFLLGLKDIEVLQVMRDCLCMVSMSEHEGFCLPILEAFGMGLPVFAFEAGAVRTTMNGGGQIFNAKNHLTLINLLETISKDPKQRLSQIQKQWDALSFYNNYPWQQTLPVLLNK
ncbi:glycosyltransferase, group 1 family protein [Leptospira ryugenii]|uniref:Glycosyltransferase, group 1 family protein n=1 Tax=Leptospira ryugenii TaxID=1917863 RepID=A0A2P2E3R6_9LEPT|nr:glycosyltransferase [Leptospira ryugenii]GBF51517.1 glycosyltransferase, group 1 family protein [Leptospira ryugenii]